MRVVKFSQIGNDVFVSQFNDETVTDSLKPRVYAMNYDEMRGFFLSIVSDYFETPDKLYGNTDNRANRVIKAYQDSKKSFGVLSTGDKGSGKTLLTGVIANRMIERGVPVVVVNNGFAGNGFVEMLDSIGECVVVLDEFGKVYDDNEGMQDRLLTLFDGTESKKRLYLMTENNRGSINEFFLDRPGRIHYHFRYGKLDEVIIRQYCHDMGIGDDVINDIIEISRKMLQFSFDTLQAIVTEYKMFGDDIEESAEILNIGFSKNPTYVYEVISLENDRSEGEGFEVMTKTVKLNNEYFPSFGVLYRFGVGNEQRRDTVWFDPETVVYRTETDLIAKYADHKATLKFVGVE